VPERKELSDRVLDATSGRMDSARVLWLIPIVGAPMVGYLLIHSIIRLVVG